MVRSIVAAVSVAAALAVPMPASAAPAQLTASTTIVAASSGVVDVYLPRDVSLSPTVHGNPDVTLSGRGRMVGLWMTRQSAETEPYSGLAVYRLPGFAGGKTYVYGSTVPAPVCTPFPHPMVVLTVHCTDVKPTAISLRRGAYRISVLTDGAPVTVRLGLRGLSARRSTVRPDRVLFSAQRDLPALDAVGDRLVTFGATIPAPARYLDVMVVAAGTFSSAPPLRERSICVRRDNAAAPPFAYSPACVGGTNGRYEYTIDAGVQQVYGGGGHAVASSAPPTGALGVGGSFGDSGGVRLDGALGIVMESIY